MGKVAFALAVLILGYMYRGWVLSRLWAWFVASQFGLPALGVTQAIGLAIVVGMLTHHSSDTSQKTELEKWAIGITHAFVYPTMGLVVGSIVSMFL